MLRGGRSRPIRVGLLRVRHHLDNSASARTVAHSMRSGGEDTSLLISVKVMFIYMQIAKSDMHHAIGHART